MQNVLIANQLNLHVEYFLYHYLCYTCLTKDLDEHICHHQKEKENSFFLKGKSTTGLNAINLRKR